MKKIKAAIIASLIFICSFINAKEKNMREIFNHIVLTYEPVASSELVEKGLSKDYYGAKKAFDGKVETTWVEGVEGDGVDEHIIFYLLFGGSYPSYDEFIDDNKKLEVELTIVNGVAKNKKIYEMNNRVKKAILEVYEARVAIRQIDPWIISKQEPILTTTFVLNLKDDIKPQKFLLRFRPKQKSIDGLGSTFLCIGRLIIKEVYPGTKYKDTGISEIDVNRIDDN